MKYHSQFLEDVLLYGLFDRFPPKNKWCFEVGAADGIWLSNTRGFIEEGWTGVLVESDPEQFEKLKENSPECHCFNEKISVDNKIDDILTRTKAPHNLDLVSIDIDGQDWYAWRDLELYRPRIVLVEYSPWVDFNFIPEPNTEGKDGRNQAGLNAMMELAKEKEYAPIAITLCNLICTAKEVCRFKHFDP